MRKRNKARMSGRLLAWAPTEMRNTMGAKLEKDEGRAQFWIESEVSVGHLERDRSCSSLSFRALSSDEAKMLLSFMSLAGGQTQTFMRCDSSPTT